MCTKIKKRMIHTSFEFPVFSKSKFVPRLSPVILTLLPRPFARHKFGHLKLVQNNLFFEEFITIPN